ncbi:MAG: hypothetical protein J5956_10135 [Ruminococcus sp.]|nr:hypothetical protein [Ruminococcus sp.]
MIGAILFSMVVCGIGVPLFILYKSDDNVTVIRIYSFTNNNGCDYHIKVALCCTPEIATKTFNKYYTVRRELCEMLDKSETSVNGLGDFNYELFLFADAVEKEMLIFSYCCKYYGAKYKIEFCTKPKEDAERSKSMFFLFGTMFMIILVLSIIMFIRANTMEREILIFCIEIGLMMSYSSIALLITKHKSRKAAKYKDKINQCKITDFSYSCDEIN